MRSHVRCWIAIYSLLLVLTACSSGGGGSTNPGTDEDTKTQQDAVSKDAHTQLDAALKAVQPCSSDVQQIKAVLDPWGRLQGVGTNSDKDDAAVRAGIAPPARAVARAFARGENVGLDAKGVNALVAAAGIDDHLDGWMDDDNCEQNWSVVYDFSAPQVGNGGLLRESGTIPITVTGGKVSGSAQVQIDLTVNPIGNCEVSPANSTATLSIGGTLQGGAFALLLNRGGYTLSTKTTCHFPAPVSDLTTPTPLSLEAFDNFAISAPAKGGATGKVTFGESTVSVTMLRRR